MNIDCEIVQDLLPLYAENLCSKESREAVEGHVKTCTVCRGALAALNTQQKHAPEAAVPLKSLSRKLNRNRWRLAAFIAAVILLLATVSVYHLTTPKYEQFAPGLAQATLGPEGYVTITANGTAGMESNVWVDKNGLQTQVFLTFFNVEPVEGETVFRVAIPEGTTPSVYYVYPNKEAVLLLGPGDPEGSFFTLPRLALNLYLHAAIALFLLSGLLWLAMRNMPKGRRVGIITVVAAAYILAHVMMKGLDGTSWNMMRDLCFILAGTVFATVLILLSPGNQPKHESPLMEHPLR